MWWAAAEKCGEEFQFVAIVAVRQGWGLRNGWVFLVVCGGLSWVWYTTEFGVTAVGTGGGREWVLKKSGMFTSTVAQAEHGGRSL